ncbi:MAG: ATP-binding protein [Phormidesmis sp.]
MFSSKRQSLSKQLTRKVLLLSVIGVLGLGSTIMVTLSHHLLSVQRQLEGANAIAAESFDLFFLKLQSDLTSLASTIEYSSNVDQNLRDFLARHPGLQGIRFIDANGQLRAHRSTFSNRLHSEDGLPDWLSTSLRTGDIAIGRVERDGPQPYTEVVTPVTDSIGIPQGFLIARIDLTDLLDIAVDIRVGQTGYAYLVGEEGHVIALRAQHNSNAELTLSELNGQSPQAIANESLSIHRGLDGTVTFATARQLQVVPWHSIVEQPASEALRPFSFVAILLIFTIFIVCHLLQRVIQFTRGRISDPLGQLSQAVAEMQQGKAIADLSLRHDDELRELANLLAKITRENAEFYDSLEAKVRQRTKELEISNRKAEAANRAKSEFLAHMSHELRTPLNAILGFSELLQKDDNLSIKQSDNLEIINRSGEHLLGLINNILEMSKIEAGQTRLTTTDFNLLSFLKTLSEMMRLKANVKQLKLSFLHSPELPLCIHADEGKLRQILLNLLANAIKFTSQGEVKLEVSSRLLDHESHRYQLSFTVSDTGSGMAPDEISKLFTPFTQTRSGYLSQKGTGLGLSISQRFVQLMDSHIQVHSEVGHGSQFSFALEVTAVESPSMVELDCPIVLGLKPSPVPYRVLVVDDQRESRVLMEQRLTGYGFEVKEAASGEAAVRQQETWLPHLIWMDIRLPGISGLEAT